MHVKPLREQHLTAMSHRADCGGLRRALTGLSKASVLARVRVTLFGNRVFKDAIKDLKVSSSPG